MDVIGQEKRPSWHREWDWGVFGIFAGLALRYFIHGAPDLGLCCSIVGFGQFYRAGYGRGGDWFPWRRGQQTGMDNAGSSSTSSRS